VNSAAEYNATLQQIFPQDVVAQLGQAYPSAQYAGTAQPYQSALSDVLGDAYTVCPTWDTAMRAFDSGANVYVYSFDASTATGGPTTYGSELQFVFGNGGILTDPEKALRDLVQAYWTNFATFGDPNDDTEAPAWAAYSNANKAGLLLTPNAQLVSNFQAGGCDLWRSVYDRQFGSASAAR
jgi:carboxylesterase type B